MPISVFAFFPAVAVAVQVEMIRSGGLQREAYPLFKLRLEPVQTAMIDGVFQACMLALGAIAVVTLQGDYTFGDLNQLLGRHKADQAAQTGVSGFVAVGCTHAAAYGHIETL